MTFSVADYIDEMAATANLDKLNRLTSKISRRLGFDYVSYIGINPPSGEVREKRPSAFYASTFVQSTYPKKWVDRYAASGFFFVDPVILSAKANLLPFCWDGERSAKGLPRYQKKVFEEGGEFGIRRGVVIPVHAPGGELGIFALATSQSLKELEKTWEERRGQLHIVGIYYHQAVWTNVFQREVAPPPILSPREVQCLEWTGRGKTLWEVSQILGISEATAKTHLRSAIKKLGAANKTHAVSKALLHGLLRI